MVGKSVERRWMAQLVSLLTLTAMSTAGLAAVELSSAHPVAAEAAPAEEADSECSGEAADREAAQAQARACGIRVESLADRTEWESLFAEPFAAGSDGVLFTWESSAQAQRARVDGEWVAISTQLTENAASGRVTPAASALPMSFSGGGDGELARIGRGGHELVMSSPLPGRLPTPVVSGSSLMYPAVLPGVDLIVTVNEDGTGFSQCRDHPVHSRCAPTLVPPHPFPRHGEKVRVIDEVEQIIKPAAGIIGRPLVQLGLHPPYPRVGRLRVGPPRFTSVHQRLRPLQFLACMNPLDPFAMWTASPPSDYYESSAPPPDHHQTSRPSHPLRMTAANSE